MSLAHQSPEDAASDAAKLLARLGFGLLAIAIPCGAVLSRPLIFSLMPIGSVLILIGALLDGGGRWRQLRGVLLSPAGMVVIFILGWSALSLVWTPFVAEAAQRFGRTAGTVALAAATAAYLPLRSRTSNLYLLPIGIGAAAIALILVVLLGPATLVAGKDIDGSTLQRAAIGLILLVWPALGVLAIRGRWTSAATLAVAVTAAVGIVWAPHGNGPFAAGAIPWSLGAFAAGAIIFALAISNAVLASRILAGLVALVFLLAPLVPLLARTILAGRGTDQAALAPLLAWSDVIRSDGLRLLTGHGLDTVTRGLTSGFLSAAVPQGELFEIWYELGIVGAAAAAALAVRVFLAAGRAPPTLAPFLLAALTSSFAITMFAVSTAQLWWLTLLCVGAVDFGAVVRGQFRTVRPSVNFLSDAPPQPIA